MQPRPLPTAPAATIRPPPRAKAPCRKSRREYRVDLGQRRERRAGKEARFVPTVRAAYEGPSLASPAGTVWEPVPDPICQFTVIEVDWLGSENQAAALDSPLSISSPTGMKYLCSTGSRAADCTSAYRSLILVAGDEIRLHRFVGRDQVVHVNLEHDRAALTEMMSGRRSA